MGICCSFYRSQQGILTRDKPGKWKGKEGGHVPAVTKNADSSYTVSVKHGMFAADEGKQDHWIEYVYAKDADNNIIAIKKFAPTDESPTLTFNYTGSGPINPY